MDKRWYRNLKKSVARRSGRGGVLPEMETLPTSLTVPWMIIGVASTEGISVSSRRFETLDVRISKQSIGSSDLKFAPVLSPFSSGVEYSFGEEVEAWTGNGEEITATADRIGSGD